ncbi:hypothetical protein EPUL_001414, partial [Erysiphe pulchra]
MYRRLESGLPEDPKFPADLKELGYFINEKDEVRNIENPKAYFQYFLTKNDRVNDLHREAMNGALRSIVAERLNNLGLEIIRLPLGAKATERNIPILVSKEIKSKRRVLVIFYDEQQDLGVFSQRILLGKGGINQGSAVNLVNYVQSMRSSSLTDVDDIPAIILANTGQLRWWRRGKKAVSQMSWNSLPSNSLVDPPYEFDPEKNTVPANRNVAEHVEYVFNHVITELTNPNSKLEIIGVSAGAVEVSVFLDNDENWKKWKPRLSAFASIASYYSPNEITNEDFRKWLIDRGRAYFISPEPCGLFLAGPDGSEEIPPRGLPTFSLGEPFYNENMLPVGFKEIIDWFEEVANDSSYVNPTFFRLEEKDKDKDTVITQPC